MFLIFALPCITRNLRAFPQSILNRALLLPAFSPPFGSAVSSKRVPFLVQAALVKEVSAALLSDHPTKPVYCHAPGMLARMFAIRTTQSQRATLVLKNSRPASNKTRTDIFAYCPYIPRS